MAIQVQETAVQLKRYRFTTSDYHRMGEAGILGEDDRVELIDGEILEMSPIGRGHISIVNRLTHLFVHAVGDAAIVSVQNPIRLGDYTEPRPDLTLVRPRADFYKDSYLTPADILLEIEVADRSLGYDLQVKAPLYGKSGVLELWVVNLKRDQALAFGEPTSDGYRTTRTFRRQDTISPVALPDLRIPVADILG